jgi:KDO2-lipid IV(A) lauroyltransferase
MTEGTSAHWLADKALRALIGGALKLPYERRVRLMGTLTRRAVGPLAGYRRRAIANLALVYPDIPLSAQRRIADAVCDNFGRTLIENYSWRELGQRVAGTQITGDGLAHLAQAVRDKRPVIFVTGHYGNHEVPRHLLTQQGHVIGGLYRPMSNPYFNDHYAQTMTSWGGPVFAQGRRGTAGFVKHLKAGGMATLLFDVASSQGQQLPFLGRQANTSTSAADVALRTDALVLPYFATRQPDGFSFAVSVENPVPHAGPLDMMREMTARLETRVTADPSQWFWVHRRWKHAGAIV